MVAIQSDNDTIECSLGSGQVQYDVYITVYSLWVGCG